MRTTLKTLKKTVIDADRAATAKLVQKVREPSKTEGGRYTRKDLKKVGGRRGIFFAISYLFHFQLQ